MDTLLEKMLTQGGALGVLVIVVWMFLNYLKAARAEDREMMKSLHEQHLEARDQTKGALLQNAESTRENTKALQSLEQAVGRMSHR